tara:strand:- start:380 stop:1213 length:834 start_codon:yes stop_codon:yes gene_type:complete
LKTDLVYFKQNLRKWYKDNNRKYSWRDSSDPWKIFLIEVLSQQTQLERANKYYNKFISEFPKPINMARASKRKVLKLWSGLGYNNRAVRLHESSKVLTKKGFEGIYPNFKELPGVGEYTNSALLSFAYNEKVITLDTNVKRIIGRYFKVDNVDNFIKNNKNDLLNRFNSRDFNQSLMDLGSLICTNRNPKCSICPLEKSCMKYIKEVTKKNPPFKNSNREKRGKIVKILINSKKVTSKDLAKRLEIDEDKLFQLIEGLKKDGIVKTSKNKYIEINSN